MVYLKFITLTGFLLLALAIGAQTKHPVQQLAQWELQANSAIDAKALNVMAAAALANGADVSPELARRIEEVSGLGLAQLRMTPLAVLSGHTLKLRSEERAEIAAAPFQLSFYEISQDALAALGKQGSVDAFVAETLSAAIREALVTEVDGKTVYRWPLHPLAGVRNAELEASFPGIKPMTGKLRAHFTSSRSLLVFTDGYEKAFSVKVSLPQAQGPFADKKIKLKELRGWIGNSMYVRAHPAKARATHTHILTEPLILGLGGSAEDGMAVRDLGELTMGKLYYLPAFTALSDSEGVRIAKLNGSDDPAAFWREHLLIPLARSTAEQKALLGLSHTSAHSQNVLVELDENLKPTGRIIMRDLDYYIDEAFFAHHADKVPAQFHSALLHKQTYNEVFKFDLFYGLLKPPAWLSKKQYGEWVEAYFAELAKRHEEITGIPRAVLRGITTWNYDGPARAMGYNWGTAGASHWRDASKKPAFARAKQAWAKKLGDRDGCSPLNHVLSASEELENMFAEAAKVHR